MEDKILIGTATKEEEKEFLEDWKRCKAAAEQEKAEFKKHEGEEGYEPHRFMRTIMSTSKPAPKQEVKHTQTSKPTLQSKPSQQSGKQKGQQKEQLSRQQTIQKLSFTNGQPSKCEQQNRTQKVQQKGQQSKVQPEQ